MFDDNEVDETAVLSNATGDESTTVFCVRVCVCACVRAWERACMRACAPDLHNFPSFIQRPRKPRCIAGVYAWVYYVWNARTRACVYACVLICACAVACMCVSLSLVMYVISAFKHIDTISR